MRLSREALKQHRGRYSAGHDGTSFVPRDFDTAARFYATLLESPGMRISSGRHYFMSGGVILALYDQVIDREVHVIEVRVPAPYPEGRTGAVPGPYRGQTPRRCSYCFPARSPTMKIC